MQGTPSKEKKCLKRKYLDLKTNPRYREEEPQNTNSHKTLRKAISSLKMNANSEGHKALNNKTNS